MSKRKSLAKIQDLDIRIQELKRQRDDMIDEATSNFFYYENEYSRLYNMLRSELEDAAIDLASKKDWTIECPSFHLHYDGGELYLDESIIRVDKYQDNFTEVGDLGSEKRDALRTLIASLLKLPVDDSELIFNMPMYAEAFWSLIRMTLFSKSQYTFRFNIHAHVPIKDIMGWAFE